MMRKIIALLGLFTFLLAVPQASIAQDERETEARAELDNKKQKSAESGPQLSPVFSGGNSMFALLKAAKTKGN